MDTIQTYHRKRKDLEDRLLQTANAYERANILHKISNLVDKVRHNLEDRLLQTANSSERANILQEMDKLANRVRHNLEDRLLQTANSSERANILQEMGKVVNQVRHTESGTITPDQMLRNYRNQRTITGFEPENVAGTRPMSFTFSCETNSWRELIAKVSNLLGVSNPNTGENESWNATEIRNAVLKLIVSRGYSPSDVTFEVVDKR